MASGRIFPSLSHITLEEALLQKAAFFNLKQKDIGEGFIRAINGRTKMILGRNYELKDSDIIRIVARTK